MSRLRMIFRDQKDFFGCGSGSRNGKTVKYFNGILGLRPSQKVTSACAHQVIMGERGTKLTSQTLQKSLTPIPINSQSTPFT